MVILIIFKAQRNNVVVYLIKLIAEHANRMGVF